MNFKVKCLGVFVAMAISAFTGASAIATGGGHFVSGSEHTLLKSVSNAQHPLAYVAHSGEVICEPGTFVHEATITGSTLTSIDLVPSYGETKEGGGKCGTQGGTPITAYTYNGCVYRLTVAAGTTNSTEQTMHFVCPPGKVLEFHQPNCLATMPSQTVANAATYTTIEESGKHAITMDLHATFETQYHGGLCVFLGTKQSAVLQGSTILKASNTEGAQVSLTAT
jgi:hypothetical protein